MSELDEDILFESEYSEDSNNPDNMDDEALIEFIKKG